MEILKTYVVPVPKRSVLDPAMFQRLHFTKGGLYFLDQGRQLIHIDTEQALDLIHSKF